MQREREGYEIDVAKAENKSGLFEMDGPCGQKSMKGMKSGSGGQSGRLVAVLCSRK